MFQFLTILLISLLMSETDNQTPEIFNYTMNTLSGEETSLGTFEGQVIMIVNTASKCGYTGQYSELQKLYETYSGKGFAVLGFPSADFGGQEYDSDEDIAEFCERNYGVSFPMFSRISVKGENQHPLFEDLTNAENADFTGEIRWNFEKFLIDREGNLIRRFRSDVRPESIEITASVEALLES